MDHRLEVAKTFTSPTNNQVNNFMEVGIFPMPTILSLNPMPAAKKRSLPFQEQQTGVNLECCSTKCSEWFDDRINYD
jgi:hypothetical protein